MNNSGMPQLNPLSSDASEINSGASLSPLAEGSASAESSVELNPPSHAEQDEFKKPVMLSPEQNLQTQTKVPAAPRNGIEVVATRKGFYNQRRIKEGDEFKIRSEEEFGEWFKCKDAQFEKKRLEFVKNKKAKK
jgi:hypothetical protein